MLIGWEFVKLILKTRKGRSSLLDGLGLEGQENCKFCYEIMAKYRFIVVWWNGGFLPH